MQSIYPTMLSEHIASPLPNFIVIQPDDHYFFKEWNPPGQFDGADSLVNFPPNSNGLPHINRIREEGLEMKSAYAASTMCGTSRYSTITGRYPSRSSYGRDLDQYSDVRSVSIPRTKLEDVTGVDDPNDCSENNIAALLQRSGYHTGVVGKWHLTSDDGGTYSYSRIQDDIRTCGFDFAEAIYKENMRGDWAGDATHNMEHITSEAIRFIEDSVEDSDKPFFLYFNPTVPHGSRDVIGALQDADCQDTVAGRLPNPPDIPYGMTAEFGGDCRAYRQSVLNRGGSLDNKMAGAVWVDDAIGSLFQTLENLNVINDTLILFQLDHGYDSKGSLFEGGSRIVQFIHYPKLISAGSTFEGLVSTIDIAATLADIAGVPEEYRYSMDGVSWKSRVINGNNERSTWNERCLFVEDGIDRSIRCGCYKHMLIQDTESGRTSRTSRRVGVPIDDTNFYDLCDEDTGKYINAPELSPEWRSTSISATAEEQLIAKIECHLSRTNPANNPIYDIACDEPLDSTILPERPDEINTNDDISSTTAPSTLTSSRPTISPTNRLSTSPTINMTVDSTDSPSSLQSDIVSETPTAFVPESFDSFNSTEYDSDCSDDPEYLYAGIDGNDCQWVIENDRCGRIDPESKQHVGKYYCQESCSFCQSDDGCFDNLYYQWKGNKGVDCVWIEANEWCDRVENADDGSTIHIGKQYCPESCGYCTL